MRPATRGKQARTAAASLLGRAALWLMGHTWRFRLEGPDVYAAVKQAGASVVLAMWHGELLMFAWSHRQRYITTLISSHADGEVIAQIVKSLGYRTIRGSSSRGGARALLQCVRELQEGRDVAITTDGPRGPRRVSAPGAGQAAVRAGARVVAVGFEPDRRWQLRSWDHFVIPMPFARITIRYAEAARGTDVEDGKAHAPAIDAALMSVCAPDAT